MDRVTDRLAALEKSHARLQGQIESFEDFRSVEGISNHTYDMFTRRIEQAEDRQGRVQDTIDALRLTHNLPY